MKNWLGKERARAYLRNASHCLFVCFSVWLLFIHVLNIFQFVVIVSFSSAQLSHFTCIHIIEILIGMIGLDNSYGALMASNSAQLKSIESDPLDFLIAFQFYSNWPGTSFDSKKSFAVWLCVCVLSVRTDE